MKSILKVKKDEATNEFYFDLDDIKDLIDIDLIDSYSIEQDDNGVISITFFVKLINSLLHILCIKAIVFVKSYIFFIFS